METVRVPDPTLQLESRRVAVDQLPGFDLPNELTNALAHMAAVEGDTTKLLNATDGKLHVLDAQIGMGTYPSETIYACLEQIARKLTDYLSAIAAPESANANLAALLVAVESIDTILTDVYDVSGHYLKTHETPGA